MGTHNLSESDLADTFIGMFGDRVRYVADRRWWLVYDGGRWSIDTTELVFNDCRRLLRDLAAGIADNPGDRERLGRLSTIRAVLRIARSYRAVAITMNEAVALLQGSAE